MADVRSTSRFAEGAKVDVVMPLYSEVFKSRILQRLIGPSVVSANAMARELGVPQATLSRWLLAAGNVGDMTRATNKDAVTAGARRAQAWALLGLHVRTVERRRAPSDPNGGVAPRATGIRSSRSRSILDVPCNRHRNIKPHDAAGE